MDQEDFLISPLRHYDVVLGTPWFHHEQVQIVYPDRIMKFVHKGKEMHLEAKQKGDTIPLVNSVAVGKSIKNAVFVYLFFVKDKLANSLINLIMQKLKNYSP